MFLIPSCKKYLPTINVKGIYIFIGVGTLLLTVLSFSMDKEWYIVIGVLNHTPDTALLKTIDQVVQNIQFTSSICVFISLVLKTRYSSLRYLAIKMYIMFQFVSMGCFLIASIVLLNRSSYSIYHKWQRINMGVAGGIYLMCFLTVFSFIFVASKFHADLKDETIRNI